jgi:hypothetical protein
MLSSNARTIRCFEIHKKEIAVVDQQISHHKFTVLKFTAMQLSMNKIEALIEGRHLVGFNEAGVHGPHRRLA